MTKEQKTPDAAAPEWALPWSCPQPANPKWLPAARIARIAAGATLAIVLISAVFQFQKRISGKAHDLASYEKRLAAGQTTPGEKRPVGTRGAIPRWRQATWHFWNGLNIYERPPLPTTNPATQDAAQADEVSASSEDEASGDSTMYLHPNMPFVVILLSPFAYLPVLTSALVMNIIKLLVLAACIWLVADLARNGRRRIPDWTLALGVLAVIRILIADIQHGNTNTFVLGAVVLHLWLFRRGRNWLAGAPLAIAICLKLTPALFLVYWAYQRNWKLLAATAAWLLLCLVVIPAAAIGPDRAKECTQTWAQNLIKPGLVRGDWFPTNVNQSLNGVAARYFLTGKNGDIGWDPDSDPYYNKAETKHGWITIVALPEHTVRWIVRIIQFAIIAMLAWAIGWRKLPRDDARRGLHYAMIVAAMMILNQRTWTHHATVLLAGTIPVWYVICTAKLPIRVRKWAIGLAAASGLLILLSVTDLFKVAAKMLGRSKEIGEYWGNVYSSYGPDFYHFVLLLAAAVLLAVHLRNTQDPFPVKAGQDEPA